MAKYVAIVKVGDSTPNFTGYRHGDIIQIVPTGYIKDFGSNVYKHFLLLDIDDFLDVQTVFINQRFELDKPTGLYLEKHDGISHCSNYRVDIDGELKKVIGDSKLTDIYNKDYSLSNISIPSLSSVSKHNIDDPRSIAEYVPGSITSGSYDIGGGSNHYANLSLFLADISNLTGNLTGNVLGDFEATAQTNASFSFNSYTLKIEVPEGSGRHQGYEQDSDFVISPNIGGATACYYFLNCVGPGTLDIGWLRVKQIDAATYFLTATYATTLYNVSIHHNIFNSNNLWGQPHPTHLPKVIFNNIYYGNWSYPVNLRSADDVAENNSCYGNTIAYTGNSAANTFRNNCSFAGLNANTYYLVASSTGYNNMDQSTRCEDADFATGSGNVVSATFANEFESNDPTNSGFFKVKSDASNALDGGSTGDYATVDIRGNTRSGTWDIGADEYTTGGSGVTAPTSTLYGPLMGPFGGPI